MQSLRQDLLIYIEPNLHQTNLGPHLLHVWLNSNLPKQRLHISHLINSSIGPETLLQDVRLTSL